MLMGVGGRVLGVAGAVEAATAPSLGLLLAVVSMGGLLVVSLPLLGCFLALAALLVFGFVMLKESW